MSTFAITLFFCCLTFNVLNKGFGTYFRIMLFCDHVTMEFSGQDRSEFKGVKSGRLYLTTHRMIFNNLNQKDPLVSFSFPFCTMKDASSSYIILDFVCQLMYNIIL